MELSQNVLTINRRNLLVSELNKIKGVVCPKPKGAFYCIAKLLFTPSFHQLGSGQVTGLGCNLNLDKNKNPRINNRFKFLGDYKSTMKSLPIEILCWTKCSMFVFSFSLSPLN